MVSLSSLSAGDIGNISEIKGERNFLSRISSIGFSLKTDVEMIQNNKRGPLIVSLKSSEVALGRNEASSIFVELRS